MANQETRPELRGLVSPADFSLGETHAVRPGLPRQRHIHLPQLADSPHGVQDPSAPLVRRVGPQHPARPGRRIDPLLNPTQSADPSFSPRGGPSVLSCPALPFSFQVFGNCSVKRCHPADFPLTAPHSTKTHPSDTNNTPTRPAAHTRTTTPPPTIPDNFRQEPP